MRPEALMGIFAGIFGIILSLVPAAAMMQMMAIPLGSYFTQNGLVLAGLGLVLSAMGLFGACFVGKSDFLGGILMLIAGIIGIIVLRQLWILPSLLFIVAGVMAFLPARRRVILDRGGKECCVDREELLLTRLNA